MVRLVFCNCSPQEAPALARRLVEENLAACVNILSGVTSFYRWDGQLCEDEEATLLIKTTDEGYEEFKKALRRYHSYEVPEIIAVDPKDVDRAYKEWVYEQVR